MVYVLIFTQANMKNVPTSIFLIWCMFYRFHTAINYKHWFFSGSFSSSWTLNIGVLQSHLPVLPFSLDILLLWVSRTNIWWLEITTPAHHPLPQPDLLSWAIYEDLSSYRDAVYLFWLKWTPSLPRAMYFSPLQAAPPSAHQRLEAHLSLWSPSQLSASPVLPVVAGNTHSHQYGGSLQFHVYGRSHFPTH